MITCNGCDETWTALGACHCATPGCHHTFSGLGLFDRHRDQHGERGRCLDPAELTDAMEYRDGMWRGPEMTDEAKAKAFGRAS